MSPGPSPHSQQYLLLSSPGDGAQQSTSPVRWQINGEGSHPQGCRYARKLRLAAVLLPGQLPRAIKATRRGGTYRNHFLRRKPLPASSRPTRQRRACLLPPRLTVESRNEDRPSFSQETPNRGKTRSPPEAETLRRPPAGEILLGSINRNFPSTPREKPPCGPAGSFPQRPLQPRSPDPAAAPREGKPALPPRDLPPLPEPTREPVRLRGSGRRQSGKRPPSPSRPARRRGASRSPPRRGEGAPLPAAPALPAPARLRRRPGESGWRGSVSLSGLLPRRFLERARRSHTAVPGPPPPALPGVRASAGGGGGGTGGPRPPWGGEWKRPSNLREKGVGRELRQQRRRCGGSPSLPLGAGLGFVSRNLAVSSAHPQDPSEDKVFCEHLLLLKLTFFLFLS